MTVMNEILWGKLWQEKCDLLSQTFFSSSELEVSSKVFATETLVVLQSGRTRFVFLIFGATTVAITTTSLMTLPVVLNVVTTYVSNWKIRFRKLHADLQPSALAK
jgi:hypothetical protein